MAQIDSGLGWNCDENFYVEDTTTKIGHDRMGNEFYKRNSGGAVVASINTANARDWWAIASSRQDNILVNPDLTEAFYRVNRHGDEWIITGSYHGSDDKPSDFPYANPDNPIPVPSSLSDWENLVDLIFEAANIQYGVIPVPAKDVPSVNHMHHYVEGVLKNIPTITNAQIDNLFN